ncbi:MAG TPA: M20/M25/M40 family metallo-hydrolase [Candidatus Bathyarchaeia archaeon]|nr:M20/M25/M40 family metallo-hydrolase [Candidatus Bathyarchaeia archaeon]
MNKSIQPLLSKLIRFQSDKDHPHEIQRCFEFLKNYLKKNGLRFKTCFSNNKISLIVARKLKKHYRYILNGHLDVVPADYPNAFRPIIKENRLYGRGAADMKGTVSVMIQLAQDMQLKDIDFALMLTSDEEVGGFDGVNYLLNKENFTCDCAIIPDGGENFRLVLKEKGIIHIKITARGKSAHASRPWTGVNAIEKLLEISQAIRKRIPETSKFDRWQPTVNLGKISGGSATNVVPAQAEMYLDFRYPETEMREKIIKIVSNSVEKQKKSGFQILIEGDPMDISPDNEYIKKILKLAKQKNIPLRIIKDYPASDGRFFSAKGIPVIMFAPVQSKGHINNEWVNIKSLETYYRILKKFIISS